jgi:hypothetical protein
MSYPTHKISGVCHNRNGRGGGACVDNENVDALRTGALRGVPYKRTTGWSSKASEAELKGVEGGD